MTSYQSMLHAPYMGVNMHPPSSPAQMPTVSKRSHSHSPYRQAEKLPSLRFPWSSSGLPETRLESVQNAISRVDNPGKLSSIVTDRTGQPNYDFSMSTYAQSITAGPGYAASEPRFNSNTYYEASTLVGTDSVGSFQHSGYQTANTSHNTTPEGSPCVDPRKPLPTNDLVPIFSSWASSMDHATSQSLGYSLGAGGSVSPAEVNKHSAGAPENDVAAWTYNDNYGHYHKPTMPNNGTKNVFEGSSSTSLSHRTSRTTRPSHHERRAGSHACNPIGRAGKSALGGKRPFICTFSFANCMQTFATKNEWKRHVSSQHIQSKVWKCDIGTCIDRKAATFNRKDLFGQHLKRMHAPKPVKNNYPGHDHNPGRGQTSTSKEMNDYLNSEVPLIQERCCIIQRRTPEELTCGLTTCSKGFYGINAWDEWMEHVGRHYENTHTSIPEDDISVDMWRTDPVVSEWSLMQEIVIRDQNGNYQLVSQGKEAVVEGIRSRKN